MTRRLRWLVALLGVLILTACNSPTGGTDNTGNKVAVATQPSATGFPLWLAQRLGYYSKFGLDVELSYFPSGAPLVEAGATGAWDAGFMGAPPGLTAADKWKMVPAGISAEESGTLVLWGREAELAGKSPAEALRGKDILVKTNSTAHYALLGCLRKLKLANQVKLVPIETNAIPSAFGGGRAAAAMTWPPFDKTFVNSPNTYTRICDGASAGAPIYDFVGLTKDFLERRPAQAGRFLRAAFRANAWIPQHPRQAAKLLADYYHAQGIDVDPAEAAQELNGITYKSLHESIQLYRGALTADLDRLSTVFVQLGAYQSKPDVPGALSAGLGAAQAAARDKDSHR